MQVTYSGLVSEDESVDVFGDVDIDTMPAMPTPPQPLRSEHYDAKHYQLKSVRKTKEKVKSEPAWWTTAATREDFTKAVHERQEQMRAANARLRRPVSAGTLNE